jgi:SAM-dependent methyltransferase
MDVRRRCFDWLCRSSRLVEQVSHGLSSLAIGTLRLADLTDFTRRSWGRFVNAGDRICIVGCGSGRDLLPFVDAGHDVVGIEPSPLSVIRLRRILARRGQAATVIEGFVEDAALLGQFDVVLFSLACYSYIPQSVR